jgi:UDP-N-acetylmuramoylalanine--D-glutamate ligase
MSCHQLNRCPYSPHIAVFLNLYEDHLDYYGTRENYFATKKNITLHQTAADWFYYGNDVPPIETAAAKRLVRFDDPLTFEMKLKGAHNQFNARFVYLIATERFGCDPAAVRAAIAGFNGLEHRMEFVANVGGVDYYNDSISTIPEATIQAATSIPGVETLLVGGRDRGIHYGILVNFMKSRPDLHFVCMYATGARIASEAGELPNISVVDDLAAAVARAREITAPGKGVALSPAAASYGYFKNFEERGDVFARLVRDLDR